jgi:hypothetical protein
LKVEEQGSHKKVGVCGVVDDNEVGKRMSFSCIVDSGGGGFADVGSKRDQRLMYRGRVS